MWMEQVISNKNTDLTYNTHVKELLNNRSLLSLCLHYDIDVAFFSFYNHLLNVVVILICTDIFLLHYDGIKGIYKHEAFKEFYL